MDDLTLSEYGAYIELCELYGQDRIDIYDKAWDTHYTQLSNYDEYINQCEAEGCIPYLFKPYLEHVYQKTNLNFNPPF